VAEHPVQFVGLDTDGYFYDGSGVLPSAIFVREIHELASRVPADGG
jgi:hypothetical protein